MTRFARAAGSKSSNERLPDTATSWSEMKMQLESRQGQNKDFSNKLSAANEIQEVKNELYYHRTIENTNNEWATFDLPKNKTTKSEHSLGKNSETKKKKKLKKAAKSVASDESSQQQIETSSQNSTTNGQTEYKDAADANENNDVRVKARKKKSKISKNSGDIGTDTNMPTNSTKTNLQSKIMSEGGEEITSTKQKRGKKRKSSSVDKDEPNLSHQLESEIKQMSNKKRDKQKKEKVTPTLVNSSEDQQADRTVQEDQYLNEFNVEGNVWSSDVKFGKQTDSKNSDTSVDNAHRAKSRKKNSKTKEISAAEDNSGNRHESDGLEAKTKPPGQSKTQKDNETKRQKDKKQKNLKNKEYKRRKPEEGEIKMMINGNEISVVKYDGFPVKKEDAQRLQELKKNLVIKGIPRSEINIVMKLERRKAEKALARERKRVCFHCRKSGHNLSDCPEIGRDEVASGICFKCGSTEHTHFECKVTNGEKFKFASCFICREQGHIAKQCPDNPKGLYPQGGSCNLCGDVTHLKKDCPELIVNKEQESITAGVINSNSQSEKLEDEQGNIGKNADTGHKAKNKIIKF